MVKAIGTHDRYSDHQSEDAGAVGDAGVYAVTVRLSGFPIRVVQGAAEYWFDQRGQMVNVGAGHLLDFNESVYGQMACVSLLHKVRDEENSDSFDDLISAIEADIDACSI